MSQSPTRERLKLADFFALNVLSRRPFAKFELQEYLIDSGVLGGNDEDEFERLCFQLHHHEWCQSVDDEICLTPAGRRILMRQLAESKSRLIQPGQLPVQGSC
jgi:hypothetical protein